MNGSLAMKFRQLSILYGEIADELEQDEAPPPKKSKPRRSRRRPYVQPRPADPANVMSPLGKREADEILGKS